MMLSPRAVLLTAMLMAGATALFTFNVGTFDGSPEEVVRLEEGDPQSTGDPTINP